MVLGLAHLESDSALCGEQILLHYVIVRANLAIVTARFSVLVLLVIVGVLGGRPELIGTDLLDGEDDVLMDFAVHGELASLSESSVAARIFTFEGLLLSVDVHVLLEILGQCERLKADYTNVLFDLGVGSDVSPQREARGVAFVTAGIFAGVWMFWHF